MDFKQFKDLIQKAENMGAEDSDSVYINCYEMIEIAKGFNKHIIINLNNEDNEYEDIFFA